MFKKVRIAILLLVLLSVTSTLLLQKDIAQDWQGTLDIRIIPVTADQKHQTKQFINTLNPNKYNDIKRFLVFQAKRYNLNLENSFNIQLEKPIENIPPVVPSSNSSKLDIILWSLKLKYWAWKNKPSDHHLGQVRLYILYQSPEDGIVLPHSTGLQNGLIGLVNARAVKSRESLHRVIITHELLHIFGASDKYIIGSGLPIYPDGYAFPDKKPLYPQPKAEVMGRSIAKSKTKFDVAINLNQILIGPKTANEIGWLKN